MSTALAQLTDVSVTFNNIEILKNINLTIQPGEQWAIVGKSGSGKTTLAQALTGQTYHSGDISFHLPNHSHANRILLIEQQHHFKNRSNTSDFYYQQRYNASDSENTITVQEVLQPFINSQPATDWIEQLHLTHVLPEPLIQLSNGENKRLQLAKALFLDPALLIMDNPFIGLDVEGRQRLHRILDTIVANGISIILITPPQELPDCITHVAVLENGQLISAGKKAAAQLPATAVAPALPADIIQQLKAGGESNHFTTAVKMVNVTIKYGEKTILQNINWEVKKGECWSISGPNGAGKSTLLSLVTADNPQAYANELYLFDQRRGSGESIWDIKRRIGFVSPELHVYFDRGTSCFDVIASGLFDTIGLFRQISTAQQAQVQNWIQLLQLQNLQRRPLFQLSLGQQRMVLLARALVKNPPLLILDEPTQGLDEEQISYFKTLVNQLCETFNTTLLYVTHYSKDLPACVKKAAYLESGKMIIK
ncbi:ABC transporter [Niastella yeongjuensis]|uniref:ABC transporter n=1 Tax=Niastella yeongjuensis TaxID=354355 RepID=A0A1V9F8L8_9BACT|nr:ATP-binding cassette domain-containing protein [Niastella yeongjuensis]OQP54587.1 ABC transporter [Niastella yeongjuensis]SEN99880.1 molybdate transport system ATP-binding protein [Niastella yeongjuensis]